MTNSKYEATLRIEAMDQAIKDGSMAYEQMYKELDIIAGLLGPNANQVFHGPPVEIEPGVFRRGKMEYR